MIRKNTLIVKEDDCQELSHKNKDDLFGYNCENCGIVTCFTDDCTLAIAKNSIIEKQTMFREEFRKYFHFLN